MKVTAKMVVVYLDKKYNGDFAKMYWHISTKQPLDEKDLEKTLEGVNLDDYVTLVDDSYPENLKHVKRPPFVVKRA